MAYLVANDTKEKVELKGGTFYATQIKWKPCQFFTVTVMPGYVLDMIQMSDGKRARYHGYNHVILDTRGFEPDKFILTQAPYNLRLTPGDIHPSFPSISSDGGLVENIKRHILINANEIYNQKLFPA
jgi:hypothetical protein